MNDTNTLDAALKLLTRHAAHALLLLLDSSADPDHIRFEDTAVNLPEHRADQILMVGAEDDPERYGVHIEFQLEPDRRRMKGWLFKNAAFNAYLDVDVVLAVVYLTRGDRATFPD